MCGKPDFYGVPGVAPCRVVVHFFGDQCYMRHEGEGFTKIVEYKFSVECIVLFGPHGSSLKVVF